MPTEKQVAVAAAAYAAASFTEQRAIQHYLRNWGYRKIRRRFPNDFARAEDVKRLCVPFVTLRGRVKIRAIESLADAAAARAITEAFGVKTSPACVSL